MAAVIKIVGLVNGESMDGWEGSWVMEYTPDGNEGRGDLVLTPHRHAAKRYASVSDAWEDWKRQSSTHPLRPHDGQPNRPMTAFTIEVTSA